MNRKPDKVPLVAPFDLVPPTVESTDPETVNEYVKYLVMPKPGDEECNPQR